MIVMFPLLYMHIPRIAHSQKHVELIKLMSSMLTIKHASLIH
jgi:hypothetical protein